MAVAVVIMTSDVSPVCHHDNNFGRSVKKVRTILIIITIGDFICFIITATISAIVAAAVGPCDIVSIFTISATISAAATTAVTATAAATFAKRHQRSNHLLTGVLIGCITGYGEKCVARGRAPAFESHHLPLPRCPCRAPLWPRPAADTP